MKEIIINTHSENCWVNNVFNLQIVTLHASTNRTCTSRGLNLCQISSYCVQLFTVLHSFLFMEGVFVRRYEALVRGKMEHAVEYRERIYIFETKQKQDKFLRCGAVSLNISECFLFTRFIQLCTSIVFERLSSTFNKDSVVLFGHDKYQSIE